MNIQYIYAGMLMLAKYGTENVALIKNFNNVKNGLTVNICSKCFVSKCIQRREMALRCLQCNRAIVCYLYLLGLFRKLPLQDFIMKSLWMMAILHSLKMSLCGMIFFVLVYCITSIKHIIHNKIANFTITFK